MSKITEIKNVLESKLPKKTITKLSQDDEGNVIVNSKIKHFDFDKSCDDLKTSDTLFINDDNIEFIEFKNRNLEPFINNKNAKRSFQKDLRLKVVESYISLLNVLNNNGLQISLDELKNEKLYFIFVFNRAKLENDPNLLPVFKSNQEQWKKHYLSIYKSIQFIDNVNFIHKYNLDEKTI